MILNDHASDMFLDCIEFLFFWASGALCGSQILDTPMQEPRNSFTPVAQVFPELNLASML